MSIRIKKKTLGFITGTVIFFTIAGISTSHAGIVADNSRYMDYSLYSSGYSISGTTSNSTANKPSTTKASTSTKNQTSTSTITNNSIKKPSTSSNKYYYISPYSSSVVRNNTYSIRNSTVKSDNRQETDLKEITSTSKDSAKSTNNIIVDNSSSSNRSNSVSLSQAIKTPSTEELPKLSSDKLLETLPEHVMTYENEKLLELINRDRTSAGLQPLKLDEELCQLAQLKSQDMYDYSYFSHTSPNFGKTSSLIRKKGINYKAYGENIGRTQSVYSAHNGFMNSPGHKANIMNPSFTHIGIGIVGNYYTEVFIGR